MWLFLFPYMGLILTLSWDEMTVKDVVFLFPYMGFNEVIGNVKIDTYYDFLFPYMGFW